MRSALVGTAGRDARHEEGLDLRIVARTENRG
jgi:hypothetical protein